MRAMHHFVVLKDVLQVCRVAASSGKLSTRTALELKFVSWMSLSTDVFCGLQIKRSHLFHSIFGLSSQRPTNGSGPHTPTQSVVRTTYDPPAIGTDSSFRLSEIAIL